MILIKGRVKDTDIVVPVQVDANGIISVAAAKGDLNNQNHGYYSGAWQKSPIPFGPSGSVTRDWGNMNTGAGTVSVYDTAVPAGDVWVITNFITRIDSATCTSIQVGQVASTVIATLEAFYAPVTTRYYRAECNLVLFPGDQLYVFAYAMTAGDRVFGRCLGYRMDVDL